MIPEKAIKKLTHEIIDQYTLPKSVCYDFIYARVQWALGIGFDIGREQRARRKAVVKMDKQGKILEVYPSMKEAANDTGCDKSHISKVCTGEEETAYGYKWRFLDPDDYYMSRKIKQ